MLLMHENAIVRTVFTLYKLEGPYRSALPQLGQLASWSIQPQASPSLQALGTWNGNIIILGNEYVKNIVEINFPISNVKLYHV